ncbi:MAG TPA: hypothetical protein VLW55_08115 [Burkholderiaceae bacterium]|nr:hypothetical protein [Burkholderiaceae bacterium]
MRQVATALVALLAVTACGNNGSSAEPPASGLQAVPGDGTVVVTWSDNLTTDYWLFVSTDPRLTTDNFTTLTDIRVIRTARSPYVLCGYADGRTLYLAMNGRTNGGPGGAGTPTINTTLRAAGSTWTPGTAPVTDFTAMGYSPITGCSASGLPTGIYIAVGPNANIATSTDGVTFTASAAPIGFTTDLNAVATYTTNPGVVTLKMVAVGAGGASIVSSDGQVWTLGTSFDAAAPTLRGVSLNLGVFLAVGDGGVVQTTTDGIAWTPHTSGTSANLQGIGCSGDRCIAVGDGGVVTRTLDNGVTWEVEQVNSTPALKKVIYGNNNNNLGATAIAINTWVAVGDGGSVAYSLDGGATWATTTVGGASDFVALSYITRFVALDSAGNSFTSQDGQNWVGPVPTGLAGPAGLTTNGVGFVAAGTGGGVASSF